MATWQSQTARGGLARRDDAGAHRVRRVELFREEAAPNVVQKASCGAGDSPETALQGQVPAAMRQAGFKGFSCNLQLIWQSRNEGGS